MKEQTHSLSPLVVSTEHAQQQQQQHQDLPTHFIHHHRAKSHSTAWKQQALPRELSTWRFRKQTLVKPAPLPPRGHRPYSPPFSPLLSRASRPPRGCTFHVYVNSRVYVYTCTRLTNQLKRGIKKFRVHFPFVEHFVNQLPRKFNRTILQPSFQLNLPTPLELYNSPTDLYVTNVLPLCTLESYLVDWTSQNNSVVKLLLIYFFFYSKINDFSWKSSLWTFWGN